MSNRVVVNRDICTQCYRCIDICPDRILQKGEEGQIVISDEACLNCGHCSAICPTGAIEVACLAKDLDLAVFAADSTAAARSPEQAVPAILLDVMKKRRSCRCFKVDTVEQALLSDLALVGTTAPSATNCQGWYFTILSRREDVIRLGEATADFYRELNKKARNRLYRFAARLCAGDRLARYYRDHYETVERGLREWDESGRDCLFHGAPAAIIVSADISSSCPVEDALLATQNILLASESIGLGTCLIGFVVEAAKRDRRIGELLQLGSDKKVCSVIACGYPAVTFQRPAGRKAVVPQILSISK